MRKSENESLSVICLGALLCFAFALFCCRRGVMMMTKVMMMMVFMMKILLDCTNDSEAPGIDDGHLKVKALRRVD